MNRTEDEEKELERLKVLLAGHYQKGRQDAINELIAYLVMRVKLLENRVEKLESYIHG
jgi:hypothetical protein